ncbi:MAG: hypothetical protein ACR2H9_02765 [Longimicrobiaceae bacterium]
MLWSAECGEYPLFAEPIRQRLFDWSEILFTIRGERVHVLHIRPRAQNPEDLLP